MKQRVAIIGSGISGLTCAYLLNDSSDITVFEANNYIGGHTATKDIECDGQSHAIDTGFIVFNDWTYPNFIKLMNKLGVARQETEMSFSVTAHKGELEYNGNTLNTLFAQRRNLFRPKFWRIVLDIVKFNKVCKQAVSDNINTDDITLFDFIKQHKLSDDFANYYILPMCAAIWSASLEQTKSFPLTFFLQFFNNHGLLNINHRPQWYTIKGGSREYIAPLVKDFSDKIKLSSPVSAVTKLDNGYSLTYGNGEQAQFDHVIFACHSDQALAMIAQPSEEHKAVLGNIPYAQNNVDLHYDITQLPKRKLAWASWNYLIEGSANEAQSPARLTYDMNILQRLTSETTFCVTLNNSHNIAPEKRLGQYQYAHPQYSVTMVDAQKKRDLICGKNNLHFCGAYWYNGFHEDGVRSALDVCERFGATL